MHLKHCYNRPKVSLLFKITNQRVSKLNFLMYFFLATSIRTFDRTLVRSCEPAQPSPPVWFSGWTLEESIPKTPVHNPAPSEVPNPSYLSVLDCQRMNGFWDRKFILRITVLILSGNDVFGNLEVININDNNNNSSHKKPICGTQSLLHPPSWRKYQRIKLQLSDSLLFELTAAIGCEIKCSSFW